jgi:putative sigma-54 modulation protein
MLERKEKYMQIIINGKQTDVTPRLRQYIERKVQRLSRLVDDTARVEITVTEEQTRSASDRFAVQLALFSATHFSATHPVRSEVRALNAKTALDLSLDKVIAQLGRQKDRQTSAKRHRNLHVKVLSLSRAGSLSPLEEAEMAATASEKSSAEQPSQQRAPSIDKESNEEIWSKIVEIRRVPTKPMGDQEAIAQMETLGLNFFPFFNEATNSVNVMYRLASGGYGLLVPELQ